MRWNRLQPDAVSNGISPKGPFRSHRQATRALRVDQRQLTVSLSRHDRPHQIRWLFSLYDGVLQPELNGMVESFIKPFKLDYVHGNPLYNACFSLKQLPKRFEDCNEYHSHRTLKMRSPREYRRFAAMLK